MLKATVSVGECSIHVMVRGNLMITIPHRLWESRVDEEGSVLWSGETRGSKALQSLVGFVQEKIQRCESFSELFHTVDEIQSDLRSPLWGMSQVEEKRQADLEKKEKEEKRGRERRAGEGGRGQESHAGKRKGKGGGRGGQRESRGAAPGGLRAVRCREIQLHQEPYRDTQDSYDSVRHRPVESQLVVFRVPVILGIVHFNTGDPAGGGRW